MKDGQRLDGQAGADLPVPAKGAKITYDGEVTGFGARVTAAGSRAFVLNYRTRAGRERRYTIGDSRRGRRRRRGSTRRRSRREIRLGHDPLASLEAERSAPTVARLCDRFVESTSAGCGRRRRTCIAC